MTTQVIVLNGGSSSGKSGIARCLQAVLPDPWLTLGTDTLVQAMPASLQTPDGGIEFAPDGAVTAGPRFRTLEAAWIEGVAAMARAGARVIVDEVFLGGADSQRRWQRALGGLRVLWIGVRCDAAVAAGREIARGDRINGMAASQAEVVHRGVAHGLEVDTAHAESMECARAIAVQGQVIERAVGALCPANGTGTGATRRPGRPADVTGPRGAPRQRAWWAPTWLA